ncbi:MAG: hypothetical protein ACRD0G_15250 [Acidimicrobiales bacterium]
MTPATIATLRCAAAIAAVMALLSLAWPAAARPLVSALAAGVLVIVAGIAIRAVHRRLPHPATESPFREDRHRTAEELPSELRRLTHGMKGLKPNGLIPEPTYWALRRVTYDRLALRHGRRIVDDEQLGTLAPGLSDQLLGVLTVDSNENPVRGRELPALVAEVEKL